jgi:hypothetical protein
LINKFKKHLRLHAEYAVFSVGANFSPDTAGHIALKPM